MGLGHITHPRGVYLHLRSTPPLEARRGTHISCYMSMKAMMPVNRYSTVQQRVLNVRVTQVSDKINIGEVSYFISTPQLTTHNRTENTQLMKVGQV